MATPVINSFQQFILTEAEQLAGQQYTNTQLMVLQNILAEYALKKVNLAYTPNDHQTWVQQEAEISGWISCVTFLIDSHTSAISTVIELNTNENPESGNDVYSQFNP